jgi:hypothetical protein
MTQQLLRSMKHPSANGALLSPEHFSPPPVSSPHPHPQLLGANIPSANFMNAVNFDQLQAAGIMNGGNSPSELLWNII